MHRLRTSVGLAAGLALAALAWLGGCTTKAAKRALNKPAPEMPYTDFTKVHGKESERLTKNMEPVPDDTAPEKAVDILVDHLQRDDPAYFIPAEDHLRYWATKQGVPEIIVRKVRMLLKNPRIETRAPALRLVSTYGRQDSLGDLIEALADEDYGMRKLAFDSLRSRTGMDLGYHPAGGEVARSEALEGWRRWWQDKQQALSAGSVAGPRLEPPAPPTVATPVPSVEQATAPEVPMPREEVLPPPKDQEEPN